jgi:hypothetical protein
VHNSSEDSSFEQRVRCACHTKHVDVTTVCSPRMIAQHRQCDNDRSNCFGLKSTTDATFTVSVASTVCPKCSADSKIRHQSQGNVDDSDYKQNNVIDKDVMSDGSYQPTASSKQHAPDNRHLTGRHNLAGFCHCRDLGPLRVCRRCPLKVHTDSGGLDGETSDGQKQKLETKDIVS